MSTKGLDQWDAQDLPRLGRLTISSHLFCRATTVPSLRTVVLTGERYIESLSALLPALEGCPALTTFSLHLASNGRKRKGNKRRTPDRVVCLPNLLHLSIAGTTSEIYYFLSFITTSSTAHIDVAVTNVHQVEDPLSVLPTTLPRHHWSPDISPNIDRLYLHHGTPRWMHSESRRACLSMRSYMQGNERLSAAPVLGNVDDDDLVRFVHTFSACRLTELALHLRYRYDRDIHSYRYWAGFFAALPHLRRLELLSQATNQDSRNSRLQEMNRDIACEFLKSSKGRRGTSLAWVLRAFEGCPRYLNEELWDVELVLSCFDSADVGVRLGRLELYIVAPTRESFFFREPDDPIDVKRLATDSTASRSVARAYVTRLEEAAEVVVIGGGWGFLEDDEQDLEATNNDGDDVRAWRIRKATT